MSPVEDRFAELAKAWKQETEYSSSVEFMISHPAYLAIIGLGPSAVPLLLREMERSPDHWAYALRALTGARPEPPSARGDLRAIAEAWIAWGKAQRIRG